MLATSLVVYGEGATVFYDFIFTRKFVSPDGYERSALVVNGELIGPTIRAFVGDIVVRKFVNASYDNSSLYNHEYIHMLQVVNVTNLAYEQEGFSIHWHGKVTNLLVLFLTLPIIYVYLFSIMYPHFASYKNNERDPGSIQSLARWRSVCHQLPNSSWHLLSADVHGIGVLLIISHHII